MKFMNFSYPGSNDLRLGSDYQGDCIDVTKGVLDGLIQLPEISSIEQMLQTEEGVNRFEETLSLFIQQSARSSTSLKKNWSDLTLRAPVYKPTKIIGIGLNYHDHAEELGLSKPKEPLLFAMFSNAIIGPNDNILIPEMSSQIDFEAELGIIIGRAGRHIPEKEALNYIAGYTIVNDVSARDLQFSDSQWIRGKTFDTFTPVGPCLTTTNELGDGSGLAISLRLNGETMQESNTDNLIFKVPELVSYCSRVMRLEPGDVIATGTPGGIGFSRKPQVFMKPGDMVEIDLEGIGTLQNHVDKE